jgi:hypothetical protein
VAASEPLYSCDVVWVFGLGPSAQGRAAPAGFMSELYGQALDALRLCTDWPRGCYVLIEGQSGAEQQSNSTCYVHTAHIPGIPIPGIPIRYDGIAGRMFSTDSTSM